MTTQDKASAEWDAMTHEQKIAWLAKFEGYTNDPKKVEAVRQKHLSHSTYDNGWLTPSGKWIHELNRKYLTDWNHWRKVEEKVMDGSEVLAATWYEKMGNPTFYLYMMKDLPTRAKALYLATHD